MTCRLPLLLRALARIRTRAHCGIELPYAHHIYLALPLLLLSRAGQVAVACMLSVLCMMVFGMTRPHVDPADLRAYWLGSVILMFSMFGALLIRGNFTGADSQTQHM